MNGFAEAADEETMVDSGVDDGAALIVNRASVLHGNIKVLAATDAGRRYPVNMRRRSCLDSRAVRMVSENILKEDDKEKPKKAKKA